MSEEEDLTPLEEPEAEEIANLSQWGIRVPIAASQGTVYIPLRPICVYLGVSSQMQVQRIKAHDTLRKRLRRFNLKTKGGKQITYCLAQGALGFWLGTLAPSAVREELRDGLIEFQEALVDVASALLGSGPALTPQDARTRAQLATHDQQIANVTDFSLLLEQRIGHIEGKVFGTDTETL